MNTYRDRSAEVPAICANCRLAGWPEDGIQCYDPRRFPADAFWLDDKNQVQVSVSPSDAGDIDWCGTCDHHQPGEPRYDGPQGDWYDALLDSVKPLHLADLLAQRADELEDQASELRKSADRQRFRMKQEAGKS